MRKFNNKNKSAFNSYSNLYKNNLFGVNYYNEVNNEYSEELHAINKRDRNETLDNLDRVHKSRKKEATEESKLK